MRDQPPRRFRGPVRWVTVTVLAMAVLFVLFTVVFPWVERHMSNPTIG